MKSEDGLEMAVACSLSRRVKRLPSPSPAQENSCDAGAYGVPEAAARGAQWYALRTRSRHEKMARQMLENKSYESFLPLYKCKRKRPDRYREVELPIFPGYLFCRFDAAVRLPILTTPGVVDIVGAGRMPIPIPEMEIDAIRRLVTLGLPAEPCPFLEVGQRVYVQDGPLRGVEGTLSGVNRKHRLVLAVTLLKRAVAVEVEREWVLPLAVVNCRRMAAGGD